VGPYAQPHLPLHLLTCGVPWSAARFHAPLITRSLWYALLAGGPPCSVSRVCASHNDATMWDCLVARHVRPIFSVAAHAMFGLLVGDDSVLAGRDFRAVATAKPSS
jgi:hypothetical protein